MSMLKGGSALAVLAALIAAGACGQTDDHNPVAGGGSAGVSGVAGSVGGASVGGASVGGASGASAGGGKLGLGGAGGEVGGASESGGASTSDAGESGGDMSGGAGESGASSAGDAGTSGMTSAGLCTLPGSIQFTSNGTVTVPGNTSPVDLSFLHLPKGFCVHYFGQVGNARQIRFAPGGELFVASPTTLTTGGGQSGQSAIVVLRDVNRDGVADASVTFLPNLAATQGLMFAPGFFYYQDGTKIMRVPYQSGDLAPSAAGVQVADITVYSSGLHWPKTFDIADDGTIYAGNGGDQGDACVSPHPFHGGILKVDAAPGESPQGVQVAKGLRNPIAVRCARGHNQCFALELAKDYTASGGGREKLIPIRSGDDWGFPCCATKNLPYAESPPGTDCSAVTSESVSFLVGDTPFALAFAPSTWPAPYANSAFVATHGAAGSWIGARMVTIAMDPTTGLPVPGSDTSGPDSGGVTDFATGWDDQTLTHGRPAALDFSTDGRLFVANDNNGVIVWIAPL
jgi:glucose/arabinose dehydrogenase